MIEKLAHHQLEIATEIRAVFQVSYAVEAQLLAAINFPPLQRPLESFVKCDNQFFGIHKNKELAAVIEIDDLPQRTLIRSLVVAPKFFRQGLASELVTFVFERFDAQIYTVETGLANTPAIRLYEKYGFKAVKQWDTDHGVRKVKFIRKGAP